MSQNKVYLKPGKFLSLQGKLAYSEGAQAWSVLRLKKEILNEFPELKEKMSKFFYDIAFVRDYKGLIEHLLKMESKNKPIPLLLWFYKIKERIVY